MSFKDRKRDDHGHVIGNDEVDGQECKHGAGKSTAPEQKLMKNKNIRDAVVEDTLKDTNVNQNAIKTLMDGAFDDDYEEEFNEPSPQDERQYVDKCMADIAKAADKKAFEYVSGNIDDLTEAGLISEETSDRLYAALDKKIDEVNNDIDKDLMDAINMADDDVLDEQFGKDTPERKLVGAIKQPQPKQKVKDINGMSYPVDQDGNISDDNKFSDENAMKDVYGENIEEDDKDLQKDSFSTVPGYNEAKTKIINAFSQYQGGKDLKVTDFDENSGYIRFNVNGGIPPSEMVKTMKSLGIKHPSLIYNSYLGKWQIDTNINKLK